MTEENPRREIEHAAMERIRRQLEQVVLRKLRAGQTRVFTDPEVLALAQKLDELVLRRMESMAAAPYRPSDDVPDA
ncbi:MAG: aspartyl-phosphate phosphatase Spo0E family protein [Bacillota bacterium]|nr:aspartyl-phosphate phosphatase Spo0E family protein [Bacillota bacterium]